MPIDRYVCNDQSIVNLAGILKLTRRSIAIGPIDRCLSSLKCQNALRSWVKQKYTTARRRPEAARDHFDLDYTRQEDVRTVVETMMTARRTHRNQMHAYFKKFLSKEAALLKPTLIPQKNNGSSPFNFKGLQNLKSIVGRHHEFNSRMTVQCVDTITQCVDTIIAGEKNQHLESVQSINTSLNTYNMKN
ncbi:hypothetical protein CJ030_MR5G023738 [Morella rubra]|uniref:Uncharacterized protein n=1 Tax=Morella rubra TaxID=262757 RepID=A0A6A1VGT5_9ROSI|nr:hypothetical protein CJ030_MR5G023738 [Morella rubra]